MVSDMSSHITATKTVLRDIAKQAKALATGLQNAAPPQNSGPGKSISYLTEVAGMLDDACRKLSGPASSDE
jgi:hypothetical protein